MAKNLQSLRQSSLFVEVLTLRRGRRHPTCHLAETSERRTRIAPALLTACSPSLRIDEALRPRCRQAVETRSQGHPSRM